MHMMRITKPDANDILITKVKLNQTVDFGTIKRQEWASFPSVWRITRTAFDVCNVDFGLVYPVSEPSQITVARKRVVG